jgi:hypothetical protein
MKGRQLFSVIVAVVCCLAVVFIAVMAAEAQAPAPTAAVAETAAPTAEAQAGATAAPTFKRGCEDCHAPGSKYSLYAGAMAFEGHPPVKAGEAADYASCMGCHRAAGKHPMAEIVHPVHMFSSTFLDKYSGNCLSCHIIWNGEYLVVPGTTQTRPNGMFSAEPDIVRPATQRNP